MHTPQTLLAHVRALTPNLAPAEQRVAAAVVHDPAGACSTARRNRLAASSTCTAGQRLDPSPT